MMTKRYNSRSAKLTNIEVLEIYRRYHEEHWSQSRLAREFNMSGVQIGRIVRGESHRELLSQTDIMDEEINPNAPLPTPEDIARLEQVLAAPKPEPKAATDNTHDLASLVEDLRRRKSQQADEQTKETRTDESQDRPQDPSSKPAD